MAGLGDRAWGEGADRAGRLDRAAAALRAREAPRLALFAPAAIGLGVAFAFSRPAAPDAAGLAAAILVMAAAAALALLLVRRPGLPAAPALRILAAAIALIALGFLAAEARIAAVEAPIWAQRERGARLLTGRVADLEVSRSGRPRLLLDGLEIEGVPPAETPARLALILGEGAAPSAGLLALADRRIALEARLLPPPAPAEPGGFDYRFHAYFNGIGALALAARGAAGAPRDLGPAIHAGPVAAAAGWVRRVRAGIARRAREASPGVPGAVVAALLVGDRSGLPPPVTRSLRDANLAHLLAISGLHMGMICVTVFLLVRLLLALPARVPSGLPAKKSAALAALAMGAVYLALAGGGAATERAFVMAACAFGAILADRPPVTLRALALAAMILLLLRPESLYLAGFQLSFAASAAMIAAFEASRALWRRERRAGPARIALLWAGALLASSLTAGTATAPFAALAFNRLSRYGLLANLAAVPAMGLWIMPLGVAALALFPFGLADPPLRAMGWGVAYVLAVAERVAALPGAAQAIPAAPEGVAALLMLGGLCLCLWRGAALKLLGLPPILLALILWARAERPPLLIAEGGRLLGAMTPEGRAFDRDPGRAAYAAELWLRRDGDDAGLEQAAGRRAFARFGGGAAARLPEGWKVELALGRDLSAARIAALCRPKRILVLPRTTLPAGGMDRLRDLRCWAVDADFLRRSGALAIWPPAAPGEPPRWRAALDDAARASARPWTRPWAPQ